MNKENICFFFKFKPWLCVKNKKITLFFLQWLTVTWFLFLELDDVLVAVISLTSKIGYILE